MTAKYDRAIARILAELQQRADGMSLQQILEVLNGEPARRTLIRLLVNLVQSGVIEKRGAARAARYHVPASLTIQPFPEAPHATIPLSSKSEDISRLVRRSQTLRKPVGYSSSFLTDYRPNRSRYLTSTESKHLGSLGRTSDDVQAAGTYAQQILNRLLIDLSWNSSRLEGNTYSLLETQRLIELGEAADGKGAKNAQMILNHKSAIEFLVQSVEDIGFNRMTILNLHALLSDNLLEDPTASGRIRREAVGISGSVFLPLGVPQRIEENFDQVLATAAAIKDPFEQAFFVMVQLPYLQPFIDVNKRVSRLAANIPLIKANLAPLSFVAVPEDAYVRGLLGVYELNRVDLLKDVFLWAYERSSARYAALRQSLGEPDQFRLKHRMALKTVIAEVIRKCLDQKAAANHIAKQAATVIITADHARFIEAAENELLAMHEGNFARYQVRPSEFAAWQDVWQRKPAKAQSRRPLSRKR